MGALGGGLRAGKRRGRGAALPRSLLRKLAPSTGAFGANLAIAIPFVLMHASADYFSQPFVFLAFLFLLALGWGATMQRTDSWWGSVLFHAGMDIAVVLGIFSTLQ